MRAVALKLLALWGWRRALLAVMLGAVSALALAPFNLLPVLAMPGLIAPGAFSPEVLQRDYLVMLVLSITLFVTAYGFRGPGQISRRSGGLLLAGYLIYQVLVWITATPIPVRPPAAALGMRSTE